MSSNTNKIIFQSEEKIREYADFLTEDVLKIQEEDFNE